MFFYTHSRNMACCDTNKKNHKIFNFTDPKFFESAEISVVVQFAANKKLFKDRLAGRENKHYIISLSGKWTSMFIEAMFREM